MIIAIVAISGFQVYWLRNNYDRESQSLHLKTSTLFHETVMSLHAAKLSFNGDKGTWQNARQLPRMQAPLRVREVPGMSVMNILQEKMKDTILRDSARSFFISYSNSMTYSMDSLPPTREVFHRVIGRDSTGKTVGPIIRNERLSGDNQILRLMINVDSTIKMDSVKMEDMEAAYTKTLDREEIDVPFDIIKIDSAINSGPNDVVIGFVQPVTYRLKLGGTAPYILGKLTMPILFSLFLVGISLAAFILLYRNLARQHRLVQLKNDFVSNITHELKTPIATMGVAIEALRNFNAINDTNRTREYLDISQNELQRLGLLVDKVLKLSMFGKKEMDLRLETVNLLDITNEVVNSMKLQIERSKGTVAIQSSGDVKVEGDRHHLLSVIFNLVDNAVKYSKENPIIGIDISEQGDEVVFIIRDNGIGIPPEYSKRIFEKFFRVPAGNTHNSKGHGLGLSYAKDVIRRHGGSITMDSQPGAGSTFKLTIPKIQK